MWGYNDFIVIITALLIGCTSSLLGCFLMLKKQVMVGDAISHSVLPGIVIAYLITSNFESSFMLIGAAFFGVFATVLIEFFSKKLRLQEDASIGMVFTWLFALGVILMTLFTSSNTDLDQECVLYGDLSASYLDKIIINDYLVGTVAFWKIFPLFLIVVLFIWKGFKGFQLMAFQEEYAISLGISASKWNLLLMILVSLTTVMAFESVGAVLVIGFLVIPPAIAYLLSRELIKIVYLTFGINLICVLLGYFLSIQFNVNAGSMIVVTNGLLLIFVILFKQIQIRKPLNIQKV